MRWNKIQVFLFMLIGIYGISGQGRPDFEWEFYGNLGNINAFSSSGSSVWVGTDRGLINYGEQDGDLKLYFKNNSPIVSSTIFSIFAESDTKIWFGSKVAVFLKNQESWETFDSQNSPITADMYIRSIAKDSLANLWFGLDFSGVLKFDGQNWTEYNSSNSPFIYAINKISVQPNGDMWFLEKQFSILHLFRNGVFKKYIADSIGMQWIYDIAIYSSDDLWVAGDSVFKWNPATMGWEKQDLNLWNGLYYNCTSLTFDPSGKAWYWLRQVGLFNEDDVNRMYHGYFQENLRYSLVFGLEAQTDTGVRFSYSDHLYRYDMNQDSLYSKTFYKGLPENEIIKITENPDGTYWLSGDQSIYAFDGTRFTSINTDILPGLLGLSYNSFYITDMEVDSKNNKWLLVENRIVKTDGQDWTVIHLDSLGLNTNTFFELAIDSLDRVWVVNQDLVRFDGVSWKRLNFNFLRPYFLTIGPDNAVWMMDGQKLYSFNGDSLQEIWYGSYPLSMSVDKQGRVWLAPDDDGVEMYDGTNWFHFYPDNEVVLTGASYDTTGWFASYGGDIIHYIQGQWWKYSPDLDMGFYYYGEPSMMFADSKRNVWIHFGNFGLIRLRENTVLPIENPLVQVPKEILLYQNYPNPFNPVTQIEFWLQHAAMTELVIYNISGQKIRTLVNQYLASGNYSFQWDGRDDNGIQISSGIYIYQLRQGSNTIQKKMVLIK